MRELKEETALELASTYEYKGNGFYGVGFMVENVAELANKINYNLKVANEAANKVSNGTIKSRNDMQSYSEKGCPQDNELSEVQIWNFTEKQKEIQALNDTKRQTDWYYDILTDLQTRLKT